MTIEETRALWERFKTADRTRDAELNRTVYAEDVVFLGTPLRGREALMKFDASFSAAFPDYRREILQEVVTADRIAFTYRYSATPTGEWLGMPATGLKLDVTGASMIAVRDGHFAEVQAYGPDVMTPLRREANLQLVRRLYDAENDGDLEAFLEFLAEDVSIRINGRETTSSREGYRLAAEQTQAAFPDWRHETLASQCDGDVVVERWRTSGMHSGTWGGLPASGRRIQVWGATSLQIARGLVQRIWMNMDLAGPLRQMATPLTGAKP
ncbi:MAG TPA: ester cyclase [Tepidiformaceae bacterium]|nr:ester cyclase [Tepidiformaceae bacterium]